MNTLGELIGKHNSRIIGLADVHGGERYNLRLRRRGDTVSLHANRNGRPEETIGRFPACETLQAITDVMLQHPRAGRWTIRLFRDEKQRITDAPIPGRYVEFVRQARQHLSNGGAVSFYRSGPRYETLEQFNRETRAALDRRITLRGEAQQGRKHTQEWQTECSRDARRINDYFRYRVSLRLCQLSTGEFRKRFAGRIPADYSEDYE